jgi:16S rRNA U1498 N3-methylase RsmE
MMPEIVFLEKFPDISIDKTSDILTSHIVLDTIGNSMRISAYDNLQYISLWVGPEGGWSDSERTKMLDNSFIFARF